MLDLFEQWYITVSKGGRTFTRANAREQIVAAYKKHQIKMKAEAASAAATTSSSSSLAIDLTVDADDEDGQIRAAFTLKKMTKGECVKYAKKKSLDTHGTRAELRDRIANHHCIDMTLADKPQKKSKGKHLTTQHNTTAEY